MIREVIQKWYKANHSSRNVIIGLGLVFSLLPLGVRNDFYLDIFIMVYFYAYMSTGWNLLGGKTGMFSLGHSGFFGIGAYVSTLLYLKLGISPWIGILASGMVSCLVGMVFFYPCFRLQGIFFAMTTFAFSLIMTILFDHFSSITGGGMGLVIPFKPGLKNLMFESKIGYYYVFWIALLAAIAVSYALTNSKFGRRLEAIREDEQVAQTLGIDVVRNKLAVVAISTFLAGVGGTLYTHYIMFITPEFIFSWAFSIQFILIAIVGGLYTVLGTVLGSFILTPLDVISRFMLNEYRGVSYAIYGLILIIMAVFLPEGLLTLVQKMFKRKEQHLDSFVESAPQVTEAVHGFNTTNLSPVVGDQVLIKLEGISKSFKGLQVLSNISFELCKNEILGLIGPNGAGKTTLINVISGILVPDKGRIFLNDEPIVGLNPTSINQRGVGRTFQIVRPFSKLSVLDNVLVGCLSQTRTFSEARQSAIKILQDLNLAQYKGQLPGTLTLAMRKRLELARALSTQPKVLLLDEVMAGLNPTEVDNFMQIVQYVSSGGVTLLMIEHVMRAITKLCNRVIVLNYGEKIAEGSVDYILNNKQVIEAYLGH